MAIEPMKVGIVGCGNISGIYIQRCKDLPQLDLVAVMDLDKQRAEAAAEKAGGVDAYDSMEAMLDAHGEIEAILNLTIPKAHTEVNLAALEAGRHVYCEKPLALNREDAKKVLDAAEAKDLRVGCAPDTVLGGGHQTARKIIESGAIGKPVGATAFMMCPGHEGWHPDPEFYYQPGGGPMLDMGPYYMTDLTMLLGPIRRVTGSCQILRPERTIGSGPKAGNTITVETPDHYSGVVDFENGVIGTVIMTFASWRAELPRIEIYGTEGSLSVPDPNGFGGEVKLFKPGSDAGWETVENTFAYNENYRGLGLADLAVSVRTGRPQRITGKQAYHVLDAMLGFLDASQSGKHVELESTFERPPLMPEGVTDGELDE
jgi:predicted dehydrogenase